MLPPALPAHRTHSPLSRARWAVAACLQPLTARSSAGTTVTTKVAASCAMATPPRESAATRTAKSTTTEVRASAAPCARARTGVARLEGVAMQDVTLPRNALHAGCLEMRGALRRPGQHLD